MSSPGNENRGERHMVRTIARDFRAKFVVLNSRLRAADWQKRSVWSINFA